MKNRNGFVSNSSSSSFVLALKDPKSVKIYGFTLRNLGLSKTVKNKKGLDKWLHDECGYTLEKLEMSMKKEDEGQKSPKEALCPRWLIFQYKASLKELEKGKIICFGSCSDESNNVIERGLCSGGWGSLPFDPKQEVKVIADCNGY